MNCGFYLNKVGSGKESKETTLADNKRTEGQQQNICVTGMQKVLG